MQMVYEIFAVLTNFSAYLANGTKQGSLTCYGSLTGKCTDTLLNPE